MGYINKITIGGESYSLVPEVASSSIYAIDLSGSTLIAYPLTVNGAGQIGLNLAAGGATIYALKDQPGNFYYGLGINPSGALGLALYQSGRVLATSDAITPLAIYEGCIGVYALQDLSVKANNILRSDNGALYAGVDWSMLVPNAAGYNFHLGISSTGLYLYTTQNHD